MVGDVSWGSAEFLTFYVLSYRVCFFVYSRGADRDYPGKLFSGYCFTRYLLCRCSFSLCAKNRGGVCFDGGLCELVSAYEGGDFKS